LLDGRILCIILTAFLDVFHVLLINFLNQPEENYMNTTLAMRRSEQGFTLVELAIVMIIIGLLIGGILKGQELIANARISSTVAQIKGIDAATSTFQEKYNGMPGDLVNATNRLQNCAAAPCNVAGADGNGLVDIGGGFAGVPATEALGFFPQLAAADLLNG